MKEHIIINKDRTVVVPDSVRKIGIQYDHKVNTLTFDCPRYADDNQSIDLSRMAIYINFSRNDKTKGSVAATNIFVDPDDPEIMHFDFVITRSVTLVNGPIICLVCAKSTDAEGVEVNHWNSELFNKLSVGEGMEAEEELTEEEIDYITSLLQEINTTRAEVADVDTRVEDLGFNQEKQGVVSEVNLEAMTWTEGSYITGSGTIGSSSGYGISEPVTLPKMSTLILDATGYQSDVAMIAKSDHTPLVTSVDGKTHYEYYTDDEIQVYISCKTTVAKSAKIVRNVGETLSDLERENSELKGDLTQVSESIDKISFISKNLYDIKANTVGKNISDDKTIVDSSTRSLSELIYIGKNKIFTAKTATSSDINGIVKLAWCDEGGNIISLWNNAINEPTHTFNSGEYPNIRFTVYTVADNFMMNYGDKLLPFAEYGEAKLKDEAQSDSFKQLQNKFRTIIVDSGGEGDYTSFTQAIYETWDSGIDVVVKKGTYNIKEEYVDLFGNQTVNSLADSTNLNGFQYGVRLLNRKVTFECGSKIVCDWTGHAADATHRFSAIRVDRNVVIDGLNIDGTALWYLVHDDYGNDKPYTNEYRNCVMIGHNLVNSNCIGMGAGKYSRHIIDNCYCNNNKNDVTVRIHNTANPNAIPEVFVSNSYFNDSFKANWYGSQTTKMRVYVNGCKAKSIDKERESSDFDVDNVEIYKWNNDETSA